MKALTLHQPYAQLVALDVKRIETRSWTTKYRGQLLIHAGARPVHEIATLGAWEVWPADARDRPHPNHPNGRPPRLYRNDVSFIHVGMWWPLAFGAIVASCTLVDAVPTETLRWHACDRGDGRLVDEGQRPFGDFTPGRFAWLLEDIKPTTERCPWCWGETTDPANDFCAACGADLAEHEIETLTRGDECCGFESAPCLVCDGGERTVDPIPARGRQQLWEWMP